MDLLLAFVITLALITLVSVRYRISPFFTLVGGSVLFGLLGGLTLDATLLGILPVSEKSSLHSGLSFSAGL